MVTEILGFVTGRECVAGLEGNCEDVAITIAALRKKFREQHPLIWTSNSLTNSLEATV